MPVECKILSVRVENTSPTSQTDGETYGQCRGAASCVVSMLKGRSEPGRATNISGENYCPVYREPISSGTVYSRYL